MGENEYAKIIAKNLKKIMYECGKTQADVAKDLKINKATISSWMNGTRIPRMDKIDLLCHYFNVKRSDLMEEAPAEQKKPVPQSTWYDNPETARIAQMLFENPEYHVLFDAAQGSSPENLLLAADLLRRLKGTNRDG